MNMKNAVLIVYSLCLCVEACGPRSEQAWVLRTESGATISLNLGDNRFSIDTIDFYEGLAYYLKSKDDSSYFRINTPSPFAEFECCSNGNYYIESKRIDQDGLVDRSGNVESTNLYWREIWRPDVILVYNYCPENMLSEYNRIMDSAIRSVNP